MTNTITFRNCNLPERFLKDWWCNVQLPAEKVAAFDQIETRGGSAMYPTVRRDIQTLVNSTETLNQELKILKQDHAVWSREDEADDLAVVTESLENLKFHILILQTDCFMSMNQMYQNNGSWRIFDCLHRAFLDLDNLFSDLKTVKIELDESYIRSADLKQLTIHYCRFKKTVGQIQETVSKGSSYT